MEQDYGGRSGLPDRVLTAIVLFQSLCEAIAIQCQIFKQHLTKHSVLL